MKSFLLQLVRVMAVGVVAASAISAQADSFTYPDIKEDRAGGVTITPMVGKFNFDSSRALDDEVFTGIGIGYRFSEPYTIELVYGTADATTSAGVNQGDVRQYRLEMLYDTGDIGKWSPYISVGAASTEFGNAATVVDDEGAMTLGFGARYHFTERVALRGDARYSRAVGDSKGADVLLALGVQLFLGETAKPVPVAPVPVAVAAPAPSFTELCAQAGGIVASDRCVKKSISTERVNLNVRFENNSDKVRADYQTEVKKLADFMTKYPTAKAVIEGHTDSKGSDAYNQDLSQRRVNEVVRLLTNNYGIAAERLSAIGYGETLPIVANDTSENRAKNRRVVASITVEIEETIPVTVQ
jgi:OmpA-OmpF porin, OOP family